MKTPTADRALYHWSSQSYTRQQDDRPAYVSKDHAGSLGHSVMLGIYVKMSVPCDGGEEEVSYWSA